MSSVDAGASGPIAFSVLQLVGLISVLLLGMASPIAMAFNIEGMVVEFGASQGEAGLVATIELAAISLSSIAVAQLVDRFERRVLALIGLGLIALASGLCLTAGDIETIKYLRALGGVGSGTLVAAVMATAAQSDKPEMTFGWINGAVGIAIMVFSLTVPRALTTYGLTGVYGLYLSFAVLAVPFLLLMPQGQRTAQSGEGGTSKSGGGLVGWLSLLGLGGVFLAHGGLVLFATRIGAEVSLTVETVGYVVLAGGALTIIGPIAAGTVGARFGTLGPVVLTGILLIVFGYLVANAASPVTFFTAVPVLMVLPLAMIPIFLGGLAVLDPTGRLAASHAAFVTMGGALGPVITGRIADANGFGAVGWFVITIFFGGTILMTLAARRADNIRRGHLHD